MKEASSSIFSQSGQLAGTGDGWAVRMKGPVRRWHQPIIDNPERQLVFDPSLPEAGWMTIEFYHDPEVRQMMKEYAAFKRSALKPPGAR